MAGGGSGRATTGHPSPAVLREAVDTARYAPSIHNTQPWRWQVGEASLDLYTDRSRQLPAADPGAHLLTLSCGAALHLVLVALRARGWVGRAARMPGPDPDLLAHVDVSGPVPTSPKAVRDLRAALARRTDRGPTGPEPVTGDAIAAIRDAAEAQGAHIHALRDDQVVELAVAASRAQAVESADPDLRAELARWVGGLRESGTGIPAGAVPETPGRSRVPERDFGLGPAGLQPPGPAYDEGASYLLLFGDEDTPLGWLRGGEALMAGWLVATRRGLSVMPLSAVVEVPDTRSTLRRLLGRIGYPYLVLRVGVGGGRSDAVRPPRLPTETIIDRPAADRGSTVE